MGRGHNHRIGCGCGWCTSTWKGGGGRCRNVAIVVPTRPVVPIYISSKPIRWQYFDEDWCTPIYCRYCGAQIFLVHHNGGYVAFDSLGKPWPKHRCFMREGNVMQTSQRLTSYSALLRSSLFGVVIEVQIEPPGFRDCLVIRCSDSTLLTVYIYDYIYDYIYEEFDAKTLLGEMVVVSKAMSKMSCLNRARVFDIYWEPSSRSEI
jgi:hypothetical protein